MEEKWFYTPRCMILSCLFAFGIQLSAARMNDFAKWISFVYLKWMDFFLYRISTGSEIRAGKSCIIEFRAILSPVFLSSVMSFVFVHSCRFGSIQFICGRVIYVAYLCIFCVSCSLFLSFFLSFRWHRMQLVKKFNFLSLFCERGIFCIENRITFLFLLYFFVLLFPMRKNHLFAWRSLWIRCVWRLNVLWQNIETTFPFHDK